MAWIIKNHQRHWPFAHQTPGIETRARISERDVAPIRRSMGFCLHWTISRLRLTSLLTANNCDGMLVPVFLDLALCEAVF